MPEAGDNPRVVVGCVKWGTRYDPDYVNVLYRAVRAHMTLPHRFLCVTDDAADLDPGIEVAPMPEFSVPRATWPTTNLAKIAMLAPGMAEDDEIVLQLDIDLMVVGDLRPFVELFLARPAFYTLREWNPALVRAVVPLAWRPDRGSQGSVNLYRAGDQRHMYEDFDARTLEIFAKYRTDRFYFPAVARSQAYLPHNWCPSFKNDCVWYWPLSLVAGEPRLPKDARILVFHGKPRPTDLLGPSGRRWGTGRKFGYEPVSWMRDYWLRYGGRLPEKADRKPGRSIAGGPTRLRGTSGAIPHDMPVP